MRAKSYRTGFAAILLVILLAGMIYHSIRLLYFRFEEGDVFPPYSSLRTDPVGTCALFESLASLGTVDVSRNYDFIDRLETGEDRTLLVLGIRERDFTRVTEGEKRLLEGFVLQGGRLVISFRPIMSNMHQHKESVDENKEEKSKNDREDDESGNDPDQEQSEEEETNGPFNLNRMVALTNQWGIGLSFVPLSQDEFQRGIPETAVFKSANVEDAVLWKTSLVLTNLSREWTPVAWRQEHPVIAERKWGDGSIVLSTDSYFLSNEAMVHDRRPAILSWLMGSNKIILFDEYHHGVQRQEGVMTLVRKYGLHWTALCLLITGLLYIWRSASPLVPPFGESTMEMDAIEVGGKDASSGLTNLLKRSIPEPQILPVSVEQWKKDVIKSSSQARFTEAEMDRIVSEARSASASPAEGYRKIAQRLKELK